MHYRSVLSACAVMVLALLVGAGSAQAASESVVTLQIEFSGASCSVSTVVVSAASCVGQDIANELTSELSAEGISSAWCGYSVNGMWECLYQIPAGCSQDDIAMTLQPGDLCTAVPEGWVSKPIGVFGTYAFDVE